MGVQRMKQDFWIQTIRNCKTSGMTVREYCLLNRISEKSYWYYHKKYGDVLENGFSVMEKSSSSIPSISFAEIRPADLPVCHNCSTVSMEKNGIKVEISEDISDEFLVRLLRVMSNA